MHKTFEDLVEAVPLTEDDLPGYAAACSTTTSHTPRASGMHVWRQLESPSAGPDASEAYAEKLSASRGRRIPAPRRASACSSSLVTAPGGSMGRRPRDPGVMPSRYQRRSRRSWTERGADAQSDLMRNGYSSGHHRHGRRRPRARLMSRVLITGSADGLGREAARQLVRAGHEVPPALAAQPLAVEQMGAGELQPTARAPEPYDGFAVEVVRDLAVAQQRAATGPPAPGPSRCRRPRAARGARGSRPAELGAHPDRTDLAR